jgi:hypothetical protein
MIREKLINCEIESVIKILYDLHRIFHKAKDGIFQTEFVDSDLSVSEKLILNKILNGYNLSENLSDKKMIEALFIELYFFEDFILPNLLKIDVSKGKKKLNEIFGLRTEVTPQIINAVKQARVELQIQNNLPANIAEINAILVLGESEMKNMRLAASAPRIPAKSNYQKRVNENNFLPSCLVLGYLENPNSFNWQNIPVLIGDEVTGNQISSSNK